MTLVAALVEEWAAIDNVVEDLTLDQWLAPTPCPAWDVRDVFSHILAAELVLAGRLGATDDPRLPEAVSRFMTDARREPPGGLLARFRDVVAERRAALESLSKDDLLAPCWTPIGPGTVESLLRMRVFDCWMHEQDVRDALGRPGHEDGAAVEITLDLISGALGYLLARQAGVPEGGIVTLEATGPVARSWHVVIEGGRGRVVSAPPRPADTVLRMPTGTLTRRFGGRVDPSTAPVEIEGDAELGQRVVASLRFTT